MKKSSLVSTLDEFYLTLLSESRASSVNPEGGETPLIGFTDRVRLFSEGVRWVAVQNKLDEEDSTDAFSRLRSRNLGRRSRRSGSGDAVAPGSNGAAS